MSTTQDVSSLLTATSTTTAAAAGATKEDPQDRFLRLLVAQVQNQDPLNPLDNAQMTSQLAQLNMVSGINTLNQTLQGLASSIAAAQSLTAANLIGHGVLAEGSSLTLQGGQAIFGASLAGPADSLLVTVKNAAGMVVHTAQLGQQPAGIVALQWDGATDAGGRAPDGTYSFSVKAAAAGREVQVTALAYGLVGGVSTDQGTLRLSIDGLGVIGLADVKQIN